MSTYGNVVRMKNYQEQQIPNLINILISGSSISTSSPIDSSSLLSFFQQFNSIVQTSVAFICLIGFMGAFNLLVAA